MFIFIKKLFKKKPKVIHCQDCGNPKRAARHHIIYRRHIHLKAVGTVGPFWSEQTTERFLCEFHSDVINKAIEQYPIISLVDNQVAYELLNISCPYRK